MALTKLNSSSMPTGSVLQVVSTTGKFAATTTSSSFFSDVTGVTLSITPKFTSSKIFIMYSMYHKVITENHGGAFQLVRNSTALNPPSGTNQSYINGADQVWGNTASHYLDSPSTTSATTYKIQIRSNVNSSRTFGTQPDQYQTITAFEISG